MRRLNIVIIATLILSISGAFAQTGTGLVYSPGPNLPFQFLPSSPVPNSTTGDLLCANGGVVGDCGVPISTVAGLGQANAFTGNESHSGTELFTGTTVPTMATGDLYIGGTSTPPTFGATAEGNIHVNGFSGLTFQGEGSSYDAELLNSAGVGVWRNITNTQTLQIVGAGAAATPALTIGGGTTGIYNVSTTGFGISVNGVLKGDYGITNSAAWTFVGNLFAPGLASLGATTTGYVCWTTTTGAISEDSVSCLSSLRKLKDQIKPLDGALNEIAALRPATFIWRDPHDANQRGPQIGMIAEDVQSVDRRLASYSSDGALHGWREDAVVALLVRGEQELQTVNDNLRAANDNLEQRLSRLERRAPR